MIHFNTLKFNTKTNQFDTLSALSQEQMIQINKVLNDNLTSSVYRSHLDQIMIHIASPQTTNIDHIDHIEYITFLFVRTLTPILHPLFMNCPEANKGFNLCKYYNFDSVYDATPGMRFNNQFSGNFMEKINEVYNKK